MLTWIFGPVKENSVHIHRKDAEAGFLELEHARVRWFLSVNPEFLLKEAIQKGQRIYRSILVEDQEIEFSGVFTDLHTRSYQEIFAGRGFGLEEARASIEIVHYIRNAEPKDASGEYHPLCKKALAG
jgi:UDP-N-acetyl-2-amino-2-deoxyglucuronate dehydrogenase